MIEIIQHGINANTGAQKLECTCGQCQCIFTADFEDFNYIQSIHKYWIKCPECDNRIITHKSLYYDLT